MDTTANDSSQDVQTGETLTAAAAAAPPRQAGDPLKRQQTLVAVGRRAISPPEQSILMQDAAALLAEALGTEYSGAAEVSADGKTLSLKITRSETENEEPSSVTFEADARKGNSLAHYVLQAAHPVVVVDLSHDERFDDAFLRRQGIRSAIAVPLKFQDQSFGALIACTREDHPFQEEEDALFAETIAHLVASTIAQKQAERLLAEERRLASEVLQNVDSLVLFLNSDGGIVRINRACQRVTGFSIDDIRGRRIWNVLPAPEEAERFQRLLEGLTRDSAPIEYEGCLLTKHSERREIVWSFSKIGKGDTPQAIVASGVDVTLRRDAEEKARRAEQTAEKARQAIARMASGQDADQTSDADPFSRLPVPHHGERRQRPRRAYPYCQKIAYFIDDVIPEQDQFEEVECKDIAAGGFSFVSPTPPQSDKLVVALGIPPKTTRLIAQIAHVTRIERNGQMLFFIGCSYVGRSVEKDRRDHETVEP